MELLVTGGAGFFGRHVCSRLRDDGHAVTVLDRLPRPEWAAGLGVSWIHGDVTDAAVVGGAVRAADAVVHAAFAPPERPLDEVARVNVQGTSVVLRAAEQAGASVVVVSSTIVDRDVPAHPLLPRAPQSRLAAYARSRRDAEERARSAVARGARVALVRPKTFLGPGAVGAFAVLLRVVQEGGTVPVLGPGTNRYQLLDVRDFAAGIGVLVAARASGVFGLGAEQVGTVREELGALLETAGTGARLRFLPSPLARTAVRALPLAGLPPLSEFHECCAHGRDSVVDTGAARALGWTPQHTGPEALVASYLDLVGRPESATTVHPVPAAHRALAALAAGLPARRETTGRSRP